MKIFLKNRWITTAASCPASFTPFLISLDNRACYEWHATVNHLTGVLFGWTINLWQWGPLFNKKKKKKKWGWHSAKSVWPCKTSSPVWLFLWFGMNIVKATSLPTQYGCWTLLAISCWLTSTLAFSSFIVFHRQFLGLYYKQLYTSLYNKFSLYNHNYNN